MNRSTRFFAALSAVTLVAGLAVAQSTGRRPHPRHGQPGEGRLEMLAAELELTESQRQEIRAILEQHRDGDSGEQGRAMREARRELEGLILDPAADEAAVAEAARRVAQQEERVALERHRIAVEIDGLLTDEQRTRAEELRQERAAGRARPRRRGPGGANPAG